MKPDVARRLVELNHRFYDQFAAEYSTSRRVLQPGILRAVEALGSPTSLLDLGCGDGRLIAALPETTDYTGVDLSESLLAQRTTERGHWQVADFTQPGWSEEIGGRFASAAFLSAFHHVPGIENRRECLHELADLIEPNGTIVISVWQFLQHERFQKKQADWSEIGLAADDVDSGDVLLDWQRGGRGLRYVHAFTEDELIGLCEAAGLTVTDTWRSDGATHDLGLYVMASREA